MADSDNNKSAGLQVIGTDRQPSGNVHNVLEAWASGTLEFAGLPENYPRTGCNSCEYSIHVSDPFSDGLYPVPSPLSILEKNTPETQNSYPPYFIKNYSEQIILGTENGNDVAAWGGYSRSSCGVPVHYDGKILFIVFSPGGFSVKFSDGKIAVQGDDTESLSNIAEHLILFSKIVKDSVISVKEAWEKLSEIYWQEMSVLNLSPAKSDINGQHFDKIANSYRTSSAAYISDSEHGSINRAFGKHFRNMSECATHQFEYLISENQPSEIEIKKWEYRQMHRWCYENNIGYLDSNRCSKHRTPFTFTELCTAINIADIRKHASLSEYARNIWDREADVLPRIKDAEMSAEIAKQNHINDITLY